jgi:hypothetical protein
VSRPALRPTQPTIQLVPVVLSPGIKRGRSVTLTTHPHLVPRSRMSRSYTSSPLWRLYGVAGQLYLLYPSISAFVPLILFPIRSSDQRFRLSFSCCGPRVVNCRSEGSWTELCPRCCFCRSQSVRTGSCLWEGTTRRSVDLLALLSRLRYLVATLIQRV